MKLAFVVMAYNRPKYLYITLDSLFRAKGIGNHPVYVAVDGGGGCEDKIRETISQFPVHGYFIRDYKLFIAKHYAASVKSLMDFGYDEVGFIEEDTLIHPQALEHLNKLPKDTPFICLNYRGGGFAHHWRGTFMVAIDKNIFNTLYNWTLDNKYYGKPRPGFPDYTLGPTSGDDSVFTYFLHEHSLKVRVSEKRCSAHIGIRGVHNVKLDSICKLVEAKLFDGPQSLWVDNAIAITDAITDIARMNLKSKLLVRIVPPNQFNYHERI